MQNLTSFELKADDAKEAAYETAVPTFEFPSIICFHLRLDHFHIRDFIPQTSCIAVLMSALHMPTLEALSISIGAEGFKTDRNEVDSSEWSQSLFNLSWTLLPDHFSNSTYLTSLSFKLWDDRYPSFLEESVSGTLPADSNIFYIPIDKSLNIQTMTISSFVPVIFAQVPDKTGVYRTNASDSSWLRELKFVRCENMTLGHLEGTVASLESLGIWNHIDRVVVQSCPHLVYDDMVNLVGNLWLQFSS